MKKLFTLVTLVVTIFTYNGAFAQPCTINTTNTTTGFTPDPAPSITQNAVYGQAVQVYVPSSYTYQGVPVTVDSITITSIAGLPTGINYSFNPASGTVDGGKNGCIWFSGTTTDTVGHYNLAFSGTVYTNITNVPLSSLASQFSYVFTVVAGAAVATCDTFADVSLATDTPNYFAWESPSVGFASGSGAISNSGTLYTQLGTAEEFTGVIGDSVTATAIAFGYVTINAGDSAKTVKVYAYSDAGGTPGAAIDSATITLTQIAAAVTETNTIGQLVPNLVNFSNAVLTTTNFYIGVTFPTTTGDTVVVFTNTGSTTYGRGYLDIEGQWYRYTQIVGGIDSLGDFIYVSLCGTAVAPVANFTPSVTSGCSPLIVTFTDASTGATGYSWSFGDGGTSTTQNPSHTYTAAGTYTVTETVTNTGGSATFSSNITVNGAPATTVYVTNASSSTATNGAAGVAVTGGTGTNTYAWSVNNSTTDTISGVAPGTYYVTVTNSNTCSKVDTVVVSFGSGINTLNADVRVKIYPNPANDELNFQWNINDDAILTVYDITGQAIRSYNVSGSVVNRLDIHEFASGLYVVRIVDKNNNEQQSLTFTKF